MTTTTADKVRKINDILKDQTRDYLFLSDVKGLSSRLFNVYSDIKPTVKQFTHPKTHETENMICMEGTIPVNYKGSNYNIPITIWLPKLFPKIPPITSVTPTATMAIKPSKYVDNSGEVYLPYLHEWTRGISDLCDLVQIMSVVFSEDPPVFSKPEQPHYRYNYSISKSMASKTSDTVLDNSDDSLYVKKGDVYCGYRRDYLVQNLTKMEEVLVVCKKCDGVMRQASLCNGETTCLVCSTTHYTSILNPVKAVQDSIEVLEIKCPLLRDCDWKGQLSEAETHLKVCFYFLVQCEKCKQKVPRIDRDDHEENCCPQRVVMCEYCNEEQKAIDSEKHWELCTKYPIFCPNNCGAKFKRKELFKHRSECELEEIECPYTEYGCKAKSMFRRDLLAHKKENIIQHTDMSLVKIQQIETENVRLKGELIEMKWKAKQLDGVELCPDRINLFADVEGTSFYVNDYRLIVFPCFLRNYPDTGYVFFVGFDLKRIVGEFDRKIGEASITHYRVVIHNEQDYNKSVYEEGRMDYRLKIGSKSKEIRFKSSLEVPPSSLIKLYFDTNTA